MPSEILAIGSSPASSGDVTVDAGDSLTVCLKDVDGPVIGATRVEVRLKDDDGQYFTIATLNGARPALVICGAGTYQFSRIAGTSGVFSG